jgi:hypothetical protein
MPPSCSCGVSALPGALPGAHALPVPLSFQPPYGEQARRAGQWLARFCARRACHKHAGSRTFCKGHNAVECAVPSFPTVLRAVAFLWNDLVFVGFCQAHNCEVVSVKQDRRAVSATWVSSFALVALVLLLLITGGVSASKLRSWRKYPDINPWAIGIPTSRSSHTMVAGSDGALWYFGGQSSGSAKSGELFKLDVQTEEWTTITTSGVSPSGRSGHTMGSTDGFLWVFGGRTASGEGEN